MKRATIILSDMSLQDLVDHLMQTQKNKARVYLSIQKAKNIQIMDFKFD